MAQGKKQIKLGNGNNVVADQTTPSVEKVETTVVEVQNTLDTTTPVDPTLIPIPPNGDEEIDEDLQINRQSSVKDKREHYTRKTRAEGRKYADGVNSTIAFADNLLEGTCNDAFVVAEYPDGHKQDDALEQYKIFRMPTKNSKPVDTTSTDFNSNVGKYRNVIYLGMKHKAGAQKWFADAKESYERHMAIPEDRKSMKTFRGTFEAVVDLVREQLARDSQQASGVAPLMTEDELFDAMRKKDNTPDDAALDLVIDAYKKLLLAKDGKEANKKTGKGGFAGIKDDAFTEVIQSLQDFAFNDLSAQRSQVFKAKTSKQKRTRRVIKAPGAPTPDQVDDDQADADAQGDAE